mmetsp:Transcript_21734/g.40910  ORF Transcript_21734/g.40910 Transcript_21734/m.40910 type:complete len:223 (+) Transcript_21734:215-883(+)
MAPRIGGVPFASSLALPVLILGSLLGSLMGHNVFRYYIRRRNDLQDKAKSEGKDLKGWLMAPINGGNKGTRIALNNGKSDGVEKSAAIKASSMRDVFINVAVTSSGFVFGSFPGFMLRWHMAALISFEHELEVIFHLSHTVVIVLGVLFLTSYYLAMIFVTVKSFSWMTFKEKGKRGKKTKKEERVMDKERERTEALKNPLKSKIVKDYEKMMRKKKKGKKD